MDILGLSFKSITDLAKQLKVSASGISKYVKKYGDINTGITAYLNKEGGKITIDGITYPTVLIALVKLDILPADYNACKNFEDLTPEETIQKLKSDIYVANQMPILFEGEFYESLLDVCRKNGKSYETVSAYSKKYGKSLKYSLYTKIREAKSDNDSSNIFNIFGINYKTKAEFFAKSNYNVSPKTIYKYMKDNDLEFSDAVEQYIGEHKKQDKKKYRVNKKDFENIAQVCHELNVSKKEYQIAYNENGKSHTRTISYFENRKLVSVDNSVESVCLKYKMNYDFVQHFARTNNVAEEEAVTTLIKGRKIYRNLKHLTLHQLNILSSMIANDLVLMPTEFMKFSLMKRKSGELVNCRTYKIHSISQATINSLVNLNGLILSTDKKDKKLYPNRDLLNKHISYSNAMTKYKNEKMQYN